MEEAANLSLARGRDDDDDDEPPCESELFLKALKSSPRLGYLVRRVVFLTYLHEYETTANHIEILANCPLIEDLKIHGYNGYLNYRYLRVLPQLDQLRFLAISRYGLGDVPTDSLGDDEDWLEIVKDLPRLEHAMVPALTHNYWDPRALKNYCQARGIKLIDHPEP